MRFFQQDYIPWLVDKIPAKNCLYFLFSNDIVAGLWIFLQAKYSVFFCRLHIIFLRKCHVSSQMGGRAAGYLSSCLFFEPNDIDGRAYYIMFEFIAQASNYTHHALNAITIGNGMTSLVTKADTKIACCDINCEILIGTMNCRQFYTSTTEAKERRLEKMKDKLHTVIESFKLSSV